MASIRDLSWRLPEAPGRIRKEFQAVEDGLKGAVSEAGGVHGQLGLAIEGLPGSQDRAQLGHCVVAVGHGSPACSRELSETDFLSMSHIFAPELEIDQCFIIVSLLLARIFSLLI